MLNEKQIEELKNQLLEKKQLLLKETKLSQNIIEELHNESSSDELDYAEVSSDTYNLSILREKQIKDLNEIDLALRKIEKNTYGICEMCDDPISVKRLRVKPHARFCIECREAYEKDLNR